MKRFKDKTVVITGADCGIGRATAIRFAKEGASVVLVGPNATDLEETAEQLPQDHTWIHADNHLTITCDIHQPHQVEAMIEHALNKFEHIDVIVNNVSKDASKPTTEAQKGDEHNALAIDLNGTSDVCQMLLPALLKSKGTIVNVAALTASGDDDQMTTYNALKSEMGKLTRTLATTHGHQGIRVNTVLSLIETGPTSDTHHSPLNRHATPKDIAAAVTFLASEDAAMITGLELPVDGGLSALYSETAK